MARKKNGNKAKPPAPKRKVPRPRVSPGFNLDGAARTYAALLADPCNSDLVPAPIGDGGGSLVVRMEQDYIIGSGATETAAAIMWIPGMPGVYVPNTPLVSDSTTYTWVLASPLNNFVPGNAFLEANAGQFRCIAGCMQVYWPGSELNRQGIISLSRTPAELPASNQVSTYRSTAQYIERTPEGYSEIVFRPNDSDMLYSEPGAEVGSSATSMKRSAIVVTAAGLPVATGVRVRIVACYEYIPDVTSGIKLASKGHPAGITLGTVLNALDRTGDWMYNTARMGARALSSMAGGVGGIMSLGSGAARLGRLMLSY